MGKSIREVYGTVLAELGDTNENIVVLDADLSGSTKSGIFAKAHPERHFNMGIAESDMVATAAGLATTGKIPFVNTFTVFLTTLGLISARAQVCYGNLNVKFGGAYCGMSDALDGATHHATEDIAELSSLEALLPLPPFPPPSPPSSFLLHPVAPISAASKATPIHFVFIPYMIILS